MNMPMTIKVEKEVNSDEMLRLHNNQPLKVRHANAVFPSKHSAAARDMTASIGRFHPETQAILFFSDYKNGTKFKALRDNGFAIHLTKNNDGNWYVDMDSVVNKIRDRELSEQDSVEIDQVDDNKDTQRPVIMIDEDEFLQDHNDGAIDITFTTPKMKYVHTVGYLNPITHRYAIRPELMKELDDFEYEMDESNPEAPEAVIAQDSIKASKLLSLIGRLQAEDEEDDDHDDHDDEVTERYDGFERGTTYAPSLGGIKALLRAMAVAKRAGEEEAVEETAGELSDLLDELEQGNAEGVDDVREEMNQILKGTHDDLQEAFKDKHKSDQMAHNKAARERKKSNSGSKSKSSSSSSANKQLKKVGKNIGSAIANSVLYDQEERKFIESKVDAGRRHDGMSDEELMTQALKY